MVLAGAGVKIPVRNLRRMRVNVFFPTRVQQQFCRLFPLHRHDEISRRPVIQRPMRQVQETSISGTTGEGYFHTAAIKRVV